MSVNLPSNKDFLPSDLDGLVPALMQAGLSRAVIEAAWPQWWDDELAAQPSGRAELHFALARQLGLSPTSLLRHKVEFMWQDEACFKHLAGENALQRASLTSFGMVVGQLLVAATPQSRAWDHVDAFGLRNALLAARPWVDWHGLLSICWTMGIPVLQLGILPRRDKTMHTMVVRVGARYAILLGHDVRHPALATFTLGHALGHIFHGHLAHVPALVDLANPLTTHEEDCQEREANRFVVTLLTAQPEPTRETHARVGNVHALIQASKPYGMEPGTLAVWLAHAYGDGPISGQALEALCDPQPAVCHEVNRMATTQLAWDEIGDDAATYLKKVLLFR